MNNVNNDYILRRSKVVNSNKNISTNNSINNKVNKTKNINSINNNPSFQDVLNKIEGSEKLKFSKHATSRLEKRNISLSTNEIEKLEGALNKAEKKGIKDALIVMDKKIFIANVKNKTIVTASTEADMEEKIFTNIDGALIV